MVLVRPALSSAACGIDDSHCDTHLSLFVFVESLNTFCPGMRDFPLIIREFGASTKGNALLEISNSCSETARNRTARA